MVILAMVSCLSPAGGQARAQSHAVADNAQSVPATRNAPSDNARLEAIGYRLATANPDRCELPQMLTGLMLHDIAGFAPQDRPAAIRTHGLTYGFGVLHLVSDSRAERAGIRRGDEIVAINGMDLEHFAEGLIGRKATYDRTEAFFDLLDRTLRNGPAAVALRRGNAHITLSLAGEPGCGGRFVALPDKNLNAWADGKYVAVTSKMIRFAADDHELAFVVAHEMAHNILEHDKLGGSASGLLAELGLGAGRIKATEIEADAYAIQLLARAGYDLSAPERLLRHVGKVRWMDLPITHPGASRRIAIITEAIGKFDRSPSAASAAP